MAFINSNDIYAFPVATRGASYPLSRLTTEQNLVNIIKSVTDITTTSGFVITGAGAKTRNADSMEFVIGGYYIKTLMNKIIPETAPDQQYLYACMNLSESGADPVATANQEIIAQDTTIPVPAITYNSGSYLWVGASVSLDTPHEIGSDEMLTITDNGVSTSYGVGKTFTPTFDITVEEGQSSASGTLSSSDSIEITPYEYDMDRIVSGSADPKFVGISFEWSSSEPVGHTYTTPILHYRDSAYYVEEEYRYKLNQNSIDNSWIDISNQS